MATEQLTTVPPLMQPVSYRRQTYYTSQYFHAQYLANSPNGGKYRQHKNFLQALRSVEVYAEHVHLGDIVEMTWDRIKAEGAENFSPWKTLFRSLAWNPLTLFNATGQAMMTHKLDDLVSKQMAVAINTTVARQHQAGKVPTAAEALLAQAQVLVDHERQLAALTVQMQAQDERLGAIEAAYTPPAGKIWPQDWIVSAGKPRLDAALWKTFLDHARRLEKAEPFTPMGGAFPRWYYTPLTLEKAYGLATRQMLLLPSRAKRDA